MVDVNEPDGIVMFVLKEELSTVPARMYGFHPDPLRTTLERPRGKGKNTIRLHTDPITHDITIQVKNGTLDKPVLVGMQIHGPSGTAYFPKAILVREVGRERHHHDDERKVFPNAFVTRGGSCLVLVDDDDAPADYDFYVLFTDVTGQYHGWLDPKLDNN